MAKNLRSLFILLFFSQLVIGSAWGVDVCPSSGVSEISVLKNQYEALFPSTSARQTQDLKGLMVSGTADEFIVGVALLGKVPPSGWPDIARDCESVLCAMTRAYQGEEASLRAMTMFKKYGYAFSVNQDDNIAGSQQIWTAEQLRRMDTVLAELPPQLFHHMPTVKEIKLVSDEAAFEIKKKRKLTVKLPKSFAGLHSANTDSILINNHNAGVSDPLETIFMHELTHGFDFLSRLKGQAYFNESSGFSTLSGWSEGHYAEGAKFVTDYAKNNPAEDLAETIGAYVAAAVPAQIKAPDKYDWIRSHVFSGQEYLHLLDWPALESAIVAEGGYAAAATSCLSNIYFTDVSEDGKYSISNRENGKEASEKRGFWLPFNFFSKNEITKNCFLSFANKVSARLKLDTEFCDQGGIDKILNHLQSRTSYALFPAVDFLANVQAWQDHNSCWDEGRYEPSCVVQLAVGQIDSRRLAEWNSKDLKTFSLLLEEKFRQQILTKLARFLFEKSPSFTFTLACYNGLYKIQNRAGLIAYRDSISNIVVSSPNLTMDCSNAVEGVFSQKGINLGNNKSFVRMGLVAVEISSELTLFQQEVLAPAFIELQSCANRSCKEDRLRNKIQQWVEQRHVDPQIIPKNFAGNILKAMERR